MVDLTFDAADAAQSFIAHLQQIWRTPQSRDQLVAHGEPELMEELRHRVLEDSLP